MKGRKVVRRNLKTLIRRLPAEVREHIEELEDLAHIRKVEGETKAADYLPANLVRQAIKGDHPIRIWREHRGLSMNELARRSGVNAAYLSEIENDKKPGSMSAFVAVARALDVRVDDLVRTSDKAEKRRRSRRVHFP